MTFFTLFNIGTLLIAIAIPVGVGFLLSSVGGGGDSEWYKKLHKPSWTPPNWLFPVAWTILYILMGIASWLVFKKGGFMGEIVPLSVYLVQLLLNFAWTPTFFGSHRIDLALVVIILLWLAVAATIFFFSLVSMTAAYLLIPYIIWVTYATVLTGVLWSDNSGGHSDITTPLHGHGGHGTH